MISPKLTAISSPVSVFRNSATVSVLAGVEGLGDSVIEAGGHHRGCLQEVFVLPTSLSVRLVASHGQLGVYQEF